MRDEQFVGMSLAQVREFVRWQGETLRIIRRDGESLVTTRDYNPKRINVAVEKDVVISVSRG